jgi:hypothetical protein
MSLPYRQTLLVSIRNLTAVSLDRESIAQKDSQNTVIIFSCVLVMRGTACLHDTSPLLLCLLVYPKARSELLLKKPMQLHKGAEHG